MWDHTTQLMWPYPLHPRTDVKGSATSSVMIRSHILVLYSIALIENYTYLTIRFKMSVARRSPDRF